jgi:hypothetical protein
MAMKGDVKAVTVDGTGAVFAGRTRMRGIIVNSNTSAANGSISLTEVGNSTIEFSTTVRADDDFAFTIPEDGILFKDGMNVTAITNCTATIILDK